MERTRGECGDVNVLGFQCLAALCLKLLRGGHGEAFREGIRGEGYVSKLKLFAILAITFSHAALAQMAAGCVVGKLPSGGYPLPPPPPPGSGGGGGSSGLALWLIILIALLAILLPCCCALALFMRRRKVSGANKAALPLSCPLHPISFPSLEVCCVPTF